MYRELIRYLVRQEAITMAAYGPELRQLIDAAAGKVVAWIQASAAERPTLKIQILGLCSEIERLLPADPVARASLQKIVEGYRQATTKLST